MCVTVGICKEEEVDPDAPTLHDSDQESVADTIVLEERNENEPEDNTNEEVKHEPSAGVQIGIQGIESFAGCIHVVDEEPGDLDAVYGVNPDLTTPELNKDIVVTMPQQHPADPELDALLDMELKNYGMAP